MSNIEQIMAADDATERKEYKRGEALWRKGDPGDCICLIISGTVALYHADKAGNETFVANYGPGKLIGEAALYDSQPRMADVKAVDDVTVLAINDEEIRQRVAQFDIVFKIIIQSLLIKMKTMADMLDRQMDGEALKHDNEPTTAATYSQELTKYTYQTDSALQKRTYGDGDILWRKGDPSDCVCLIISGNLALYHADKNGEETFIANYGHDELIGEAALYDSQPRMADVKAVGDTVVLATSGKDLRQKIKAFDSVSAIIIQDLLDKMKTMADMLDRQMDKNDDRLIEQMRNSALPHMPGANTQITNEQGTGLIPPTGSVQYIGANAGKNIKWGDKKDKQSTFAAKFLLWFFALAVIVIFVALMDLNWSNVLPASSTKKQIIILQPAKPIVMQATMTIAKKTIIRSMPSQKGRNVGTLEAGSEINVIGKIGNNKKWWYEIERYGGQNGYVLKDNFAK